MNPMHVHLMVNHLPILGTVFSVILLAVAMLLKNEQFQKVSLCAVVVLALGTIIVYWSGDASADRMRSYPGISVAAINDHAEAGLWTLIAMSFLGAVSLMNLIVYRRRPKLPPGLMWAMGVLCILVLVIAMRTAWIGGKIRHPEIWTQTEQLIQ